MLQIIHKDKGDRTIAQVKTVLKKLPNLPDLKPERKMVLYSLREPDMNDVPKHARAFIHWGREILRQEISDKIPPFVTSKILACQEWEELYGVPNEHYDTPPPDDDTPPSDYDDDIPF